MNGRKIKNKKLNGLIIKSFIIIAVVMLLSILPTQSEINEKNKNNRKVIYCYKLRIGG